MPGHDEEAVVVPQSPTRTDLFANAAFHIAQKRFMVPRALSLAKGNNS
jgi:hypothetical protein